MIHISLKKETFAKIILRSFQNMSANIVYSVHADTPVVASGNKVGNRVQTLPANRAAGQLCVPRVSWLTSQYPNDFLTNKLGQTISSIIPKVDNMEDLDLRIALTIAGGSLTMPACELWFDQQDLYDPNNGSSQPVQTQYDMTALANLFCQTHDSQQRAFFKTSGIESRDTGKYGASMALPPGTHYFYMPLLTFFRNYGGVFLQDMKDELRLDLKVSSVVPISGAGSIASCKIEFGISGHLLTEADRSEFRRRYFTSASECYFLHPHRSSKQVTLTCGSSENFIDLNDVRGVVSHQLILVRPLGATNANNGKMFWYNIGDAADARIELMDIQGYSITGTLPTRFMRQHQSTQFPNDWISHKPAYIISYCHSVNEALKGEINGGRVFSAQSGDRLRFVLPAAATQEVQTFTQSGTPAAGGWYRFRFRGEESSILVGSANAAAMKAAFEAMRGVAAKNLTVAFSAAASAGASFTATFTDPEGTLDGDLVEVIPGDAFAASSSTARTIAAIPGLPASGTYQVDVFSYVYRTANFSGLAFNSKDLVVQPPRHVQ